MSCQNSRFCPRFPFQFDFNPVFMSTAQKLHVPSRRWYFLALACLLLKSRFAACFSETWALLVILWLAEKVLVLCLWKLTIVWLRKNAKHLLELGKKQSKRLPVIGLLFAATSLWNVPALQADYRTYSQRNFLSANGIFRWDMLWLDQFHVLVKIVAETSVKERITWGTCPSSLWEKFKTSLL